MHVFFEVEGGADEYFEDQYWDDKYKDTYDERHHRND